MPPPEPAAPSHSLKISSGPRPRRNNFRLAELTEELPAGLWAYAVGKRNDIDVHETYRLFRAYHEGERKTEAQWLRLWRVWVAREKPVCPIPKTAAKPPDYHALGDTRDEFIRKSLTIFEGSKRRETGDGRLSLQDRKILEDQARRIFDGEDIKFGLESFRFCAAQQLRETVRTATLARPRPRLVVPEDSHRSAAS